MKISNATPLKMTYVAGRLPFPGHSLSLIVKGTFDLSPGGSTALSEEQLTPSGDESYPDDDEKHGAPRYESDFAFYKPRADLLLVGKCHPPSGRPVRECPVTFRVGTHARTLVVSGDRRWERHGLVWRATEPEPFTEMELRYENSFGGPNKSPGNPIGKGDRVLQDESGNDYRPLPNIEDPVGLTQSPRSRPPPAGFGPLGREWEPRRSQTGSFDGSYLETRWPWFPEDFDWTHFNAAPEAMQLDGFLRGDEELHFENLHSVRAKYQSRLPGLTVRCFVRKTVSVDSEQMDFLEVPMGLDTLWVDMEAEKLVLVWRGWTEVLSEDFEEVRDLFIMSESLDQPTKSAEQCYQLFLERRAAEEKAFEKAGVDAGAGGEEAEQGSTPDSAVDREPRVDAAQVETQVNALLAQVGIDVANLPPEIKEKHAKLLHRFTETDPKKAVELERRENDARVKEAFRALDLDPDNLPPPTAEAKAEQLRFMKELGMNPADLSDNPELGRLWAMTAAVLPKAGMDPENLEPLVERMKKQRPLKDESGDGDEDGKPADLTREIVQERAERGESFAEENLRGLDLSGLELKGIDFSGALLGGAVLTGANLEDAILTGADMTETDLSAANLKGATLATADLSTAKLEGANLSDADLTTSNLTGANLAGASLADTVFQKALMPGAVLDRVDATGAIFAGADLTGARLMQSICAGADFSKAVLDRADLRGAQLTGASMEHAVARQANMADTDLTGLRAGSGSNFTGSIFWRAVGAKSIWETADLTGCDLRAARMPGATFTSACLNRANLSAADMKFSRFNRASLSEAQLIQMNMFQGNLEKANLTRADLRGSNLYGVEFLGASMDGADVEGANLKMTKLHDG